MIVFIGYWLTQKFFWVKVLDPFNKVELKDHELSTLVTS